ncbi:MAG: hypothetical protein M3256_17515 [Actinomycetota bacterium]|nr:hypothetical protein [Actinomycetota bacterium]MDQ6948009.1 hypothetical protein [Actinomycetota bacterium]
MLKRLRWITMGAAVGFGGSVWAQRRVKRTVERFLPDRVGSDAVQRARYLADDVRDALKEGRTAMHVREEELRRQLGVTGTGHLDAGMRRIEVPEMVPARRGLRRGRQPPVIDVADRAPDNSAELYPQRRPRRRRQDG